MKLTLAEIRWMQRGLMTITSMPMPIKISYKLAKLLNLFNEEMMAVEKAREALIKRMAVEDPAKPGELRVAPENEDKFREEFAQLLQEEVEVNFEPIKLAELGDDIKISPIEMASLAKIIEDEPE